MSTALRLSRAGLRYTRLPSSVGLTSSSACHHPISASAVLLRGRGSPLSTQRRNQSSSSSTTTEHTTSPRIATTESVLPASAKDLQSAEPPALSLLPTATLLRSILITTFLSQPLLLRPSMALMQGLAHASSALLNPDRNPLLHFALRKTFYDQFAAGENAAEVRATVQAMKDLGFKGVILGYAKECVVDKKAIMKQVEAQGDKEDVLTAEEEGIIRDWVDGNLRTLEMIGPDDYLALKFTGAGPGVIRALAARRPPPALFWDGLIRITEATLAQGSKLWTDAEQLVFQDAIDDWTIDLMRRYNTDRAVVYNTIQAYLKRAPASVARHLRLARDEGWVLGVKLVRGAYIGVEDRDTIWDTKHDTDKAYDDIVRGFLEQRYGGLEGDSFPPAALFLASHNLRSVLSASEIQRARILAGDGRRLTPVEFGQLQGMADDVSCAVLLRARRARAHPDPRERAAAPRGFKYLTWGSVQECLGYLLRRAVENAGALDKTRQAARELREEGWRRLFGRKTA